MDLHFLTSAVSSSRRLFALSFIPPLDHPFTFFSFVHFTSSPWDIRSCTTNSGTFCMTSTCRELQRASFHPSSFQDLLQFLVFRPLHFHLVLLLPVFRFIPFFVFDQRAILILPNTLLSCSLRSRVGIIMRACLLLDARNHFLSDFIPHLSLSAVLLFLLFFSASSTFGNFCSFHACISFSLSTTKDTALCGLVSKSSTTLICEFFP